jgi:hypothetical protein
MQYLIYTNFYGGLLNYAGIHCYNGVFNTDYTHRVPFPERCNYHIQITTN